MQNLKKITSTGMSLLGKGVKKSQQDRLDPRLDPWQKDISNRILGLAEEVRRIGTNGQGNDRASMVARKLEQTADYLRFRPASNVARDALDHVHPRQLAGIGVAVCGAVLAYKLIRGTK